jgi:hypothetical protein
LKSFVRLSENILSVRQCFLNCFHLSRPVEGGERYRRPGTRNNLENVEKSLEFIHEDRRRKSINLQTPLGSVMKNWRCSQRWLWRMASSGMLRCVTLVRTDISEELSASIIIVTRSGDLWTLAVTRNRRPLRRNTDTGHPDDGGAKFLRNIGSYKSHTSSHLRRRHSSFR